MFPLFPFTIIGGVLVQLAAVRFGFEWAVNRRAVEGLGGISVDGIVVCAIGTLSLAALGAHLGPLILLAAASVGWSVFVTMIIGPRVFPKHWFEHSLAEFGESQGNVATGFVMVDMVDPARHTDRLREVSERIERLEQALPSRIDPQLRHFLQRRSYSKALELLEN